MMNILKLLQDVFFQLIIIQIILRKINAYYVNLDFLKQRMNRVYIAKLEKMEDLVVKNVNIKNIQIEVIQKKLVVKNVVIY